MVPDFKINTVADLYTLYVLIAQIPEETFWNTDIRFLELVYINKMSWESYIKNPKER